MSGGGTSRDKMFEPLGEAERGEAERAASPDNGEDPQPIVPVPNGVPDPDWRRLRTKKAKGALVGIWTYYTADRALAFHVARWPPAEPNGPKVVRPATWCRLPDGREGWTLAAMPVPQPLYKLPEILETTSKPVVVVEGEKCAEAAAQVFPDCLVTTWAGGTPAWKKTDWEQLAGREILLVADGDDPGRTCMLEIAAHLAALRCSVRHFLPSRNDGYDIADAIDDDDLKRKRGGLKGIRKQVEQNATLYEPAAEDTTDTGEVTDTAKSIAVADASNADGAADAPDTAEADDAPDAGRAADKADAADNTSWIDDLVERAQEDPGTPFEPETLEKIRELKRTDRATWIRLRTKLREGVRGIVGELDRALKSDEIDLPGSRGRTLEWDEDELWPEEVDGTALLDEIAALIRRYVDMPETSADTVALWTLYAWLHERWDISTFLVITSPTKRCGKSLLLEVMEEFALRPLNLSGHTTSAALFRTVEEHRPTLFLDEADTYLKDDDPLRGLINGSQRRRGAHALRMVKVGDDLLSACFATYCAKIIAGIGNIPGTIVDRSIQVEMQRRAPGATRLLFWGDRNREEMQAIRRRIARWTEDNADSVYRPRLEVPIPPGLHDRARDAWASLLSIAERAGGEWAGKSGRAWRACETITAATIDETDRGEMLLADIRKVFHDAGDPDHLPTGKRDADYDPYNPAILPALTALEGRPWPEYSRGQRLSPRKLADLLKRFKITSSTIRLKSGTTPKGYKRESFVSVWKRYDIGDPEEPPDS